MRDKEKKQKIQFNKTGLFQVAVHVEKKRSDMKDTQYE